MTDLGNAFIDNTLQCWSCPIFDRMFQVVSDAAAVAYPKFVEICVILFCAIFAFYVFGAIWKNMKDGFKDGWFNKSLRPIFINSLFALTFLGMGVMLPRFITTITFEPVAEVTKTYSTAMLKQTNDHIEQQVPYTPVQLSEDQGIFRPELKNAVIDIAKVTITQFQIYMKLGVAMLDAGLSWSMFLGIGAIIKHIILALVGLYLFIEFFKMFFKFLCYFADVVIAMAMFAFFFPLSLVTSTFKEADDVPSWLSWIKTLGKGVGVEQIKNLINAIVSLGAAVITYTVILVIIAKFFTNPEEGINHFDELLTAIMNGEIFETDLDKTAMNDLSITSVVVLVYVLTFIYNNIPNITKTILNMFDVAEGDPEVGKGFGGDLMATTKGFWNKGTGLVKTIIKKGKS